MYLTWQLCVSMTRVFGNKRECEHSPDGRVATVNIGEGAVSDLASEVLEVLATWNRDESGMEEGSRGVG